MAIKRILIAYFTFTLWLMVFHDTAGQNPPTVGYGESCGDGTDNSTNATCDIAKYFTCNARDVCECEKEMYYESLSLQCVSVEGGNCSSESPPKYCIINSLCHNSTCVCEDKFVPAKNGQCLLSYNEGCQSNEDCSDLAFLTCKRGRCDCHNDMTQVWSLTEKKCQILLNEPCRNSSGPECVTNAKCDESSTCVCDDGFVPDSDRCAVAYNGTCTEDEDCTSSGFFICNSGSCGCDSTQIYNGEMCLVKVEESCAINPHCVKGASCDNEEKCRCNSHYLPNPADNTTCSPIYGGDCDIETAVDACGTFPEFSLQCSPDQNKCMCKPLYEYSNEDGKCHGSLKANCTVGVSLCVDYAQCSTDNDKCTCKNDYITSPTGDECFLKHGASCSNVTDALKCDSYQFVTCSAGGYCQCDNPSNITYQAGKCVALAESLCMTAVVEYKQLNCIENATCTQTNSSSAFNGICNCNENFEQNEQRMCFPSGSNPINSGAGIILLAFICNLVSKW